MAVEIEWAQNGKKNNPFEEHEIKQENELFSLEISKLAIDTMEERKGLKKD
jgi:hypothetical protein